ncbi:hypothetical protein Cflav_PD3638 [Pedosphaera parvula Ellin514]|uniref:Uncharacterized protein n=1 Tax=Pedosphaera parvula (strain Ellin514) TaxID=320771 RepID=B9XHE5_PEDPL|nr:hypothetical protein Cflav_PD3638 [Pedosphaera parvula Ellin514]
MRLVSDTHAFADGFGFFAFIDEGDGKVFCRDAALAQFISVEVLECAAHWQHGKD